MNYLLDSVQLDSGTAQTYRTSAFGSKKRKQHATQQPHRHDMRFQVADKTPPTYRTTHPATDRATHPPTNLPTMLQQYSSKRMRCFVLEPRQSRLVIQRRVLERTKYFFQNTAVVPNTVTAPFPTCTKAPTHARNNRHPPTQPTARQPTKQSYLKTLHPICATAVQQCVPAGTCTNK